MSKKEVQVEGSSLVAKKQLFTRTSQDAIYDVAMRTGGEPFGAPFEMGLPSLTERIVKFFKQAGFFGFETLEKLRPKNRRNKFTRHGAARHVGEYNSAKK